jgi:ribosome-binding protein aMBF1 (putative translation factor)
VKTIDSKEVHAKHMAEDPEYRAAYDALEEEFALIEAMMDARKRSRLSQSEIATRMGTTESVVSRLESGRVKPSTRTLERYAAATGHKLKISFEPLPKKSA